MKAYFRVIEALNMASVSVLAAASYFPEYIRARISAGVLFSMIRQQPKIDNMSHAGERPASCLFSNTFNSNTY